MAGRQIGVATRQTMSKPACSLCWCAKTCLHFSYPHYFTDTEHHFPLLPKHKYLHTRPLGISDTLLHNYHVYPSVLHQRQQLKRGMCFLALFFPQRHGQCGHNLFDLRQFFSSILWCDNILDNGLMCFCSSGLLSFLFCLTLKPLFSLLRYVVVECGVCFWCLGSTVKLTA